MPDAAPVAIVTGAGSGIGRACAALLAAEGWRVVLAGRREAPLRETASILPDGAGIVHAADVTADGASAALVAAASAAGALRGVVANAGLAELAAIEETDRPLLERHLAVNLVAPALLVAAAVPALRAAGGGRIAVVSSLAAADPFPGFFAYAAAKAGAESLARSVAAELADDGIEAWSLAPGAVETPMLRGLFDESVVPREAATDPADVARVVADAVLGRRPEPSGAVISVTG